MIIPCRLFDAEYESEQIVREHERVCTEIARPCLDMELPRQPENISRF